MREERHRWFFVKWWLGNSYTTCWAPEIMVEGETIIIPERWISDGMEWKALDRCVIDGKKTRATAYPALPEPSLIAAFAVQRNIDMRKSATLTND
jgi:hypothetical protein